ncbi:sigma-70 family RNA polymerase sigma factor [Peribacillus butanolivorans]|uniref:Sigma-70 family RNA polymerase sigma factor n=1 Tax=Peribacillus butanolivorans TaxID=421767 RepID=A0ABN5N6B1_9BACI|nr:sigma-70 family RNA polymerase sigma factor [Peribacillus butanolivorans]AXN39816.1 sigma-70 family RNA polymerase sigma factor [Peribacillus butanolivorans]
MNELKKLNINRQAAEYISEKDEAVLSALYRDLQTEYRRKIDYWSKTTTMANQHDMQALFDEMFMSALKDIEAKDGDFVKLFHLKLTRRYNTLLRDLTTRRKFEVYEKADDDEAATSRFEIADEFNLEDTVIAKKKADQRMLIDSLMTGADATTTAIVEAFLNHPKPTATAIAKEMGVHHSKVTRALNRLAGKFSTKQHGDFRDYLIAL